MIFWETVYGKSPFADGPGVSYTSCPLEVAEHSGIGLNCSIWLLPSSLWQFTTSKDTNLLISMDNGTEIKSISHGGTGALNHFAFMLLKYQLKVRLQGYICIKVHCLLTIILVICGQISSCHALCALLVLQRSLHWLQCRGQSWPQAGLSPVVFGRLFNR